MMLLADGVLLLSLLPSRPESAMTVQEIRARWAATGGVISDRSVQRYMNDLIDPPLELVAEVRINARERRFYLRASKIASWFMSEEAALGFQLTRQVVGRSFGTIGQKNANRLSDMADEIFSVSTEIKRVRDRLRIVPDGIGRLPAKIAPAVLHASIDAISKAKKLKFTYASSNGNISNKLLTPLGLVAKDGTIYLVATSGLSDSPRHFPLQRIQEAEVHFHGAQDRPYFDLDRYIVESHQFSHTIYDHIQPVSLVLQVAPVALFHFAERPLSMDQKISHAKKADDWHIVSATIPVTVLLYPFLVSMGPWIKVLEPPDIRKEVAKWLRESSAHYENDTPL